MAQTVGILDDEIKALRCFVHANDLSAFTPEQISLMQHGALVLLLALDPSQLIRALA